MYDFEEFSPIIIIVAIVTIIFGGLFFTMEKQEEKRYDTKQFEYQEDAEFVIVDYQKIDNGVKGEVEIHLYKYVDLNTGVMYLYTQKNRDNSTMEVLYNADGSVMVYEDLELLRFKYDWEE